MKSISIPFRFESSAKIPASSSAKGTTASTTDNDSIARQKIADVLATRKYERVMRPEYGGAISDLLFEPLDPLVFADYRIDALADINQNISNAYIRDIQIGQPDVIQYNGTDDSTLNVRVVYDVAGKGTTVYSFIANSTTILTEESPI